MKSYWNSINTLSFVYKITEICEDNMKILPAERTKVKYVDLLIMHRMDRERIQEFNLLHVQLCKGSFCTQTIWSSGVPHMCIRIKRAHVLNILSAQDFWADGIGQAADTSSIMHPLCLRWYNRGRAENMSVYAGHKFPSYRRYSLFQLYFKLFLDKLIHVYGGGEDEVNYS